MNYYNLKRQIKNRLKPLDLDETELETQVNLIIEDLIGLQLNLLILKDDLNLSLEQEIRLTTILNKRLTFVPLQYVLGYAYFGELKLKLTQGVFIPRSDTLALVFQVINIINSLKTPNLNLLEIGIGSGAIAIALLKHFPDLNITGIDINPIACKISKENAQNYGVAARLKVINTDLISFKQSPAIYHGLIANPPYISYAEYLGLDRQIILNEPKTALIGSDTDGLGFYRQIAKCAHLITKPAFVAVEIGDRQAQAVSEIFKNHNFADISIYQDANGLDRVLTAQ